MSELHLTPLGEPFKLGNKKVVANIAEFEDTEEKKSRILKENEEISESYESLKKSFDKLFSLFK